MFRKLIETFADKHLESAWHELNRRIAEGFATAGGGLDVQAMLLVAKNGDDGTGQRGNLGRPYLTIQAAVNAAQDGDAILVAPGLYTENVVIPPAVGLALVGAGEGKATIAPDAGVALAHNPSSDHGLIVSGFTFAGDVQIQPSVPDFGLTVPWRISDCDLRNAVKILVRRSMYGSIHNVQAQGCEIELHECTDVRIEHCWCNRIVHTWDTSQPPPVVTAPRRVFCFGVRTGIAEVRKQGLLSLESCDVLAWADVFSEQEAPLSSNVAELHATGCNIATLRVFGQLVDSPYRTVVRATGCKIETLEASNTGPVRLVVEARNCGFTPGAGWQQANANTDLDLRGSEYTTLTSAGGGRIDRSIDDNGGVVQAIGAAPTPFLLLVPYIDAQYEVLAECQTPGGTVTISGKTLGGFSAQGFVAGVPAPVNAVLTIVKR